MPPIAAIVGVDAERALGNLTPWKLAKPPRQGAGQHRRRRRMLRGAAVAISDRSRIVSR